MAIKRVEAGRSIEKDHSLRLRPASLQTSVSSHPPRGYSPVCLVTLACRRLGVLKHGAECFVLRFLFRFHSLTGPPGRSTRSGLFHRPRVWRLASPKLPIRVFRSAPQQRPRCDRKACGRAGRLSGFGRERPRTQS